MGKGPPSCKVIPRPNLIAWPVILSATGIDEQTYRSLKRDSAIGTEHALPASADLRPLLWNLDGASRRSGLTADPKRPERPIAGI